MGVTMKDLAKELGVSIVTVSKSLADKEGVSESVRQQVKELARKRGYRMNRVARQLRQGNTQNIGILLSESFGRGPETFYWSVHSQLSLQLTQLNYTSILEIVSSSMEKEKKLPCMLQQNKVDGIIVLGQIGDEYLSFLNEQSVPFILLDFYTDNEKYLSVTTNNFQSSFISTSYVISCGHKDIGFLGNIRHSTSSIQDRFLGFYKAMLEHDLPIRDEWIINDRTDRGRILEQFALPNKLPTAFVCNCDESAYKLLEQLNKMGLRVPEDISLIGFDNSIYSQISKPQITTVAVDVETLTHKAAELITYCINHQNSASSSVVVPGKMIYRDSVRILNEK